MSTTTTLNNISAQTLAYAPVALSAISSVEAADAAIPGVTKKQIAVNMILAGSQIAEGVPVPSVAAAGLLINLLVSILNATGIFSHKAAPAPVATVELNVASQGGQAAQTGSVSAVLANTPAYIPAPIATAVIPIPVAMAPPAIVITK
jgi:hypothetical protein